MLWHRYACVSNVAVLCGVTSKFWKGRRQIKKRHPDGYEMCNVRIALTVVTQSLLYCLYIYKS
jgi:hypothetical protein